MSTQSPLSSGLAPQTDDSELTYKPISPMSVVSLIFGVVALGAFFSGYFWLVPPVALVIAGLTSRSLEQAREEYAGQLLAKLGLLLAVVALVGAPTIHFTKRFLLGRETRVIADRFLDLILENKIKDAYALTARLDIQASAQDDADEIQKRMGRESYMQFLTSSTVQAYQGKGADAQVNHQRFVYEGRDKGVEKVVHFYVVNLYKDDEISGTYSLLLMLSGGVGPDWQGRKWMVEVHEAGPYEAKESKYALLRALGL
jgi:hypothetical protein